MAGKSIRVEAIARDLLTHCYLGLENENPVQHYLDQAPSVRGEYVRAGDYLMAVGLLVSRGACALGDDRFPHLPGLPTPELTDSGVWTVEHLDGCLGCVSRNGELKELRTIVADGVRARAHARSQVDIAALAALEAGDAAYVAVEARNSARDSAEAQDAVGARQAADEAEEAAASARESAQEVCQLLDELGLNSDQRAALRPGREA